MLPAVQCSSNYSTEFYLRIICTYKCIALSRAERRWSLETLKYHSEGCSCSIYDQSESRMYQKASGGVS